MNTYSPVTPEVISHLAELVGEENLSTRQSDLDLHAHDQSRAWITSCRSDPMGE